MLDGIAQFGVLLLLLLTGMDTDVGLIRKVGRPAIAISLTGIAIPFACGVSLAFFLPDPLIPHVEERLATALFLGVALSISSIKIVAMVVHEMNVIEADQEETLQARRRGARHQDGAYCVRDHARHDGLSGNSGVRSVGTVRGQTHQEPRRHRSRG